MQSIPTVFLFRVAGLLSLFSRLLSACGAVTRDIHACSCEETDLLMTFVKSLGVVQWSMHLDLHETTDSDLYEFRPAKASRDGVRHPNYKTGSSL